VWLKNWVCHTHLKFKIEKGVAGISYEPHPHNFQNLYDFWRYINVINIIFGYFCSVLIFKNSQWVIRPCTSVVLDLPQSKPGYLKYFSNNHSNIRATIVYSTEHWFPANCYIYQMKYSDKTFIKSISINRSSNQGLLMTDSLMLTVLC